MIQGRDFLAVDEFLKSQPEEAFVRTRIGRLYYAAYMEARTFCETSLGFERTRHGREHQEVARLLSAIDADLSSQVRFLRNFRNAADYDLHLSHETMLRMLNDGLDLAQRIVVRLDELAGTVNPR